MEKIIKLTEENLFNPSLLSTKAWINLKEKLQANEDSIRDDLELYTAVLALSLELPFSHFSLLKQHKETVHTNFSLKEINATTCILKIPAFSGHKKSMENIITVIKKYKYKTLIIDLRNNPGGDNETSISLANFLIKKEFTSGFFPNKKWYTTFSRHPDKNDTASFTIFTKGSLSEFYKKAQTGYGTTVKNKPAITTFIGKIYVLINQGTASTAEAFTLALKENEIALIIGTRTSGQLLSAKKFRINNNLDIFIPLNNYISYLGYKVDKKGIEPDITIKDSEIGDYILKHIVLNND
ncbi:MAG TPA: S41 family peptidase [Ferruginibacter sp.]|nr:S41 family peptidase [Ferruginibacter sp.]